MTKDNYDVGYGKPPKSGRFKTGQSGNPKGRPKGSKPMSSIIDDEFRKKITIREEGKVKKVSRMEALLRRIVNEALKGDPKATDQSLKLIQMLNALKEQASFVDDGTAPDAAADEAIIADYLSLLDIKPDTFAAKDADDD